MSRPPAAASGGANRDLSGGSQHPEPAPPLLPLDPDAPPADPDRPPDAVAGLPALPGAFWFATLPGELFWLGVLPGELPTVAPEPVLVPVGGLVPLGMLTAEPDAPGFRLLTLSERDSFGAPLLPLAPGAAALFAATLPHG